MKKALRISIFVCLSAVGLFSLVVVGTWSWTKWEYHLSTEKHVRERFESHKADYLRLVDLLQKDHVARFVDDEGMVDGIGVHGRSVPEYRRLVRDIGAEFVLVRDDGSMEFALYGYGCAICSDSYMGVRYVPKDHVGGTAEGWTQTVVASLESAKLPQENGSVASDLYVVAIEPEWFVYRFEYQE
jgi:hypothetical protein